MTAPGRTIVTIAIDAEMHRDLTVAARSTNRSIAEEVEVRLTFARLVEESIRILKAPR
jgi:hypothetical protein